jgi:hypothetical protein
MQGPRISLNKLGEYLTASASRRRRIIHDQQDPKAFIATRYADAREAIVDFLVSGASDKMALFSKAQALRADYSGSDFAIQDRIASAEAIEKFALTVDEIKFGDSIALAVPGSASEGMDVAGVYVSVRPDVYLRNWKTGEIEGAVKLHFPKTSPLTAAGAEYVATAMRVYMRDGKSLVHVDHRKCYVVDVPTSTVTSAPKAFAKKLKDIAAACEEIEARWYRGQAAA